MKARRAKIVGTLGPATSSVEKIAEIIAAGVDVVRLNMSHGTHEAHKQVVLNVREASRRVGKEVAILLDLQGPKIRVDKVPTPLELKSGEIWYIGTREAIKSYPQFEANFIPTIYEKLVDDAVEGCTILFDDGLLEAKGLGRVGDLFKIQIIDGGLLKSNKGINLPDVKVSAPSMTEKDHEDLLFGLAQGVDYVALSFVRTAQDIKDVKAMLHRLRINLPIVSKIEKPEAIENIQEILKVTDVIMIARGDMGVEIGNHKVPGIQKMLISECNRLGIPVITATQMLESMIEHTRPTRAEASDVANAIWDGTDAVMLSAETASGAHPVEAVKMMDRIICEAEHRLPERPLLRKMELLDVTSNLQVAASMMAEKLMSRWVVVVTQSGHSALKMSRFRSRASILAITNSVPVTRKMALYWGIQSYLFERNLEGQEDLLELEQTLVEELKSKKMLDIGDKIVIVRGAGKYFRPGTSNSIRVEIIMDRSKKAGMGNNLEMAEFPTGKILFDRDVCASCQSCIGTCPHNIWMPREDDKAKTTLNISQAPNCAFDMECVNGCPTGAIEIIQNEDG